jgi:hypothetical protein
MNNQETPKQIATATIEKLSRYRPEQALGYPEGYGLWIFSTFDSMKVVRSSALRTGRIYSQDYLGTHC